MSAARPWPRIGLGCAVLGTPPPALTDADAERVIAAAIERGIRFFDVAPLYGGGLAEERLGRALRGLPRDEYILCTKAGVTRPYAQLPRPDGAARPRQFDVWDYSATAIRASVERSLARLHTDRLDVVHLHDAEDHLAACLDGHAELARLREQGIVGRIGIGSNLATPVEHLLACARFDAFLLAGCYTLLDQTGRTLIEAARARGVRVVAGGVFNSGVLAAWPQPTPTFGYRPADAAVLARTERIARICMRHGIPIAAIALQFVLAHPAIDTVLLGPRTIAELDANLAAIAVAIPDAVWNDLVAMQAIPADSPRPRRESLSA